MPFAAKPVRCSDKERAALQTLIDTQSEKDALAQRASLILRLASGETVVSASKAVGMTAPTARNWRDRYNARGVSGLYDEARPGRPSKKGSNPSIDACGSQTTSEGSPLNEETGAVTSVDGKSLPLPKNVVLDGIFVSSFTCVLVMAEPLTHGKADETAKAKSCGSFGLAEMIPLKAGPKPTETKVSVERFITALVNSADVSYHVVVCGTQVPDTSAITDLKSSVTIYLASTLTEWLAYAKNYFGSLGREDGSEINGRDFCKAVKQFTRRGNAHTAPFVWLSRPMSIEAEATVPTVIKSRRLVLTSQLLDENGRPLGEPVRVERMVNAPESLDYSSARAFLKTLDPIEQALLDARNELGQKALQSAIDYAGSKKKG